MIKKGDDLMTEKDVMDIFGDVKDEFCIDCGGLLPQLIPGIISGALRTDGNKDVKELVPGGVVIGNKLGYVCCECSVFGPKENEVLND